jgi:threonine aldolase
MNLEEIENSIRLADSTENFALGHTKLICLENTWFGYVLSLDYMQKVRNLAQKYGIKVHLDGARIFNASHALNVEPREIAQYADTLQCCLSKGE